GTETAFRSWVFTVAHSRLVDERRRTNRRPETTPYDGANEPAETRTPEDDSLQALEVARIAAICAQLPDEQRAVVLLRIVGDLSTDQVAAVLGKSPGAVKQLQRRGFEKARALFTREGVTL